MALALIDSKSSSIPANLSPLIGENYHLKLTQSIQNLLVEIHKENPKFSHFIQVFYDLMQAQVDPPLESIWVYAALTFRSRNHPKEDPLNRISAAKDLFQLVSACSASVSSLKSIALLAPVVYEVYNVVVDLFKRDLSLKAEKKGMKAVQNLVGVVLGYANVCSCKDLGENDGSTGSSLITPFADLIRVWMNSNEGSEFFLHSDVFRGLSEREGDVGYLAGVVIAEVFLLKLCLNFKLGTSTKELEMELRTWAIASITGFQNFYLFG